MPSFQRPFTYDPSLAAQLNASGYPSLSKEERMAELLGLKDCDEDSELDLSSDGSSTSSETVHNGALTVRDLESLAASLQQASEEAMRAEQQTLRAEARARELQEGSRRATQLLSQRHTEQVKGLQDKVDRHKSLLDMSQRTLEVLRSFDESNAGALPQDIDLGLEDIGTLSQDKLRLSKQINALTQEVKALKVEATNARAQADAQKTPHSFAISVDQSPEHVARLKKAEVERHHFRTEIRKRLLEKSTLLVQLERLQVDMERLRKEHHLKRGTRVDLVPEDVGLSSEQLELMRQVDQLREELVATKGCTASRSAALNNAQQEYKRTRVDLDEVEADTAAALTASHALAAEWEAKAQDAGGMLGAEMSRLLQDNADMEQEVAKLASDIRKRQRAVVAIQAKAQSKIDLINHNVNELKGRIAKLSRQTHKTETECDGVLHRSEGMRKKLKMQKAGDEATCASLHAMRQLIRDLRSSCNGLHDTVPRSPMRLYATQLVRAISLDASRRSNTSALLLRHLNREMGQRRAWFNTIQELKGNIRVYCRIRPLNAEEAKQPCNKNVILHPSEGEMLLTNSETGRSSTFEFEKIFKPDITQALVFGEVEELITSVLDGFNVCIFAYGQTGSGKTYTMQGPRSDPGVNIRALQALFARVGEKQGTKYHIEMTLLEIYNEQVKDLTGTANLGKNLKIVQGKHGMDVQGITVTQVKDEVEVLACMKKGAKGRHVTSTQCNIASSRSHLVLSVYVSGFDKLTGKATRGKLHLIDLAGSERVARSGATGRALLEVRHINKSLSALGNCIEARGKKRQHVPYRDSALTYLLQDSLEKNSKTLMVVQISGALADYNETICSLKFASRVREVELGKATSNSGSHAPQTTPRGSHQR